MWFQFSIICLILIGGDAVNYNYIPQLFPRYAGKNDFGIKLLSQWKPANQSYTYFLAEAYNAVDGDIYTTTNTGFHMNVWWYVDLLQEYIIRYVIIVNRGEVYYNPLQNVSILCGKTLQDLNECAYLEGTGRSVRQYNLSCECVGRYIRLERTGNSILCLQEVRIYGSPIAHPECLMRNKQIGHNYHYAGSKSFTVSNRSCQQWSLNAEPHLVFDAMHDNYSLIERWDLFNFCRQFDEDKRKKPWCYTIDPSVEWEFCDIPMCAGDCLGPKVNKNFYFSGTQNVTKSGKQCQRWAYLPTAPHDPALLELDVETRKSMENYCYTSGSHEYPWCYTMDTETIWEYCDNAECYTVKKNCLGPIINGKYFYQGTQHVTKTKKNCQRWDSLSSDVTDRKLINFDNDTLKSMKNYCRTPLNYSIPGCYTAGPNSTWEECGIRICDGDTCYVPLLDGEYYYRGTQHVTISGKDCQRWDSLSRNLTNGRLLNFENATLTSMKDYCRTVFNNSVPGCFTTGSNSTWEECGIQICGRDHPFECLMRTKRKAHHYHYSGTKSVTVSNRTCQHWFHDEPHPVFDAMQANYSIDSRKYLSNFCRQFDEVSRTKPWCYTTDPKVEWEYCDIPMCAGDCLGPKVNKNFFFSGTQTVTKSGKQCQRWDASIPTVPKDPELLELDMETRKSMENYCYTSKSIEIPWCYTMDTLTQWEYCDNAECYTIEKNCLGPIIDGKYFYQGTHNFTKSEKSCQRWDSLSSDVADSQILNFDNDTLKSMEDYCRTPLNYSVPGCYTAGPNSTWEECGIRVCDGDTCFVPLLDGKYYYRGTQNVTISEKNCQRWDSLSLDVAVSALLDFDNGTLKSMENYCRTTLDYSLPGCYTSGPNSTWEGCDIQRCGRENCYRRNIDRQYKYQGTQNIPMNGKPCKRWDNLPDISMGGVEVGLLFKHLSNHTLTSMENYCRPLFNGQAPFCFTEYPNDIDKNLYVVSCNIPRCEG